MKAIYSKACKVLSIFNVNLPFLLVGAVGSLTFSSCGSDDISSFFPDEYNKILYVKGNATRDVSMNTMQDTVVDSITVLKGGSYPREYGQINIRVMTDEEVMEIWGLERAAFHIIPNSTYNLSDSSTIITMEEWYKTLRFNYHPCDIYKVVKTDPNGTWVLPLKIESTNWTVNRDKDKVLIRFAITAPLIEWDTSDINTTMSEDTLTVSLPLKLSEPGTQTYSVTCSMDITGNNALVAGYNASHGTTFNAMPDNAYTLSDVTLSSKKTSGVSVLTVTRDSLEIDHTYLLPVKIGALTNDSVDKTEEVRYIIISNFSNDSFTGTLHENPDGTLSQGTKGTDGKTIDNSGDVLSKRSSFINEINN